jgi:hypothetical protein
MMKYAVAPVLIVLIHQALVVGGQSAVVDYSCEHAEAWLVNEDGHYNG